MFQTAEKFTELLNAELKTKDPSLITGYPEAPLAYDAVWALAFALNKTAIRSAAFRSPLPPQKSILII